ncbi:MAG: insulinase family protein [Bacteroidetes bacterium]|nr:insulinase family protein [Bacteroidota bacterium]
MLDRSVAPAFSKDFSFDLPSFEIRSLNSGANLIILQGLQQEVVKLEIIFKAGKWHEPALGVSHFTSNLLDKGTDRKSAKEISGIFDYYGSQIEISPGYDFTSVSLYVLKKFMPQVLPIFLEIISSPAFPESELNLQKEIFIQNLKINNQKNNAVASKLIRKNIFGSQHPYGSSVEEQHVAVLTPADLTKFYKTNFSPAEIYLHGNFTDANLEWISSQFGLFTSQTVEDLKFDSIPEKRVCTEDRPESVQSSIRLGKEIINRSHPDYFPLLLLNHILGGYFGSRLMKNIREDKGLTYGIYSSLHPFKNSGMFSIGADVNKENKEIVFTEIKKELALLRDVAISEEELTTSKNHFLGSLQLEVANPFSSFDKIKNIRLNGLSDDYYKLLFSSIRSSSASSLKEIANKYLIENSFHEVSVG